MLLDMPRLEARDRPALPAARSRPPLTLRIERALAGYVQGQLLLSLIIGTSAGVGMWLFGVHRPRPGRRPLRAALRRSGRAFVEVIPYIGPWLSAVPPFDLRALRRPDRRASGSALLFLFIHQIEGHVVVPNVMANALRLHPLLVIFGLLAGGEIYGLPGVLIALPMLAAARAIWEFFSERVALEPWQRTAAAGAGRGRGSSRRAAADRRATPPPHRPRADAYA